MNSTDSSMLKKCMYFRHYAQYVSIKKYIDKRRKNGYSNKHKETKSEDSSIINARKLTIIFHQHKEQPL